MKNTLIDEAGRCVTLIKNAGKASNIRHENDCDERGK